ncbi:hypothetical protein Dimus_035452, partial [Dionaea muscipula]
MKKRRTVVIDGRRCRWQTSKAVALVSNVCVIGDEGGGDQASFSASAVERNSGGDGISVMSRQTRLASWWLLRLSFSTHTDDRRWRQTGQACSSLFRGRRGGGKWWASVM